MKVNTWEEFFYNEKTKKYFKELESKLEDLYNDSSKSILPKKKDIYNAFNYTKLADVKICIIGQDPYPTKGVAHGLAFSTMPGNKVPKSLENIYKEIKNEYEEFEIPKHGYLKSWADQGVFMLNTVLTVEESKPDSHKALGWQEFTTSVVKTLSESKEHMVFILWGGNAKKMKKHITNKNHLILEGVHPSPLSVYRGFIGCNHFKLANDYLNNNSLKMVKWQLPLNI